MSHQEQPTSNVFDLHVTFTGLCLFVPSEDGQKLHIILPDPVAACGSGMPAHYPGVFYHHDHEPGSTPGQDGFNWVPFSGLVNLASNAQVTPRDTCDPITCSLFSDALVPNVTAVAAMLINPDSPAGATGATINRAYIDGTSQDKFAAAVITLPGGRLLSSSASRGWAFGQTTETPLAWKVEWLVEDIASDSLQFAGADGKTHTLVPLSGSAAQTKKVISLRVKNVPVNEKTPDDPPYRPGVGNMGQMHFRAFYALLNHRLDHGPIPELTHLHSRRPLGMLITCTPGTGQLG